jgi:hypothetical protein
LIRRAAAEPYNSPKPLQIRGKGGRKAAGDACG